VGGDELALDIAAKTGATALVTTPAAGKVYRSRAEPARQRVMLRVQSGARLEWLPQETILFEGASLDAALRIDFEKGSHFLAWDAVCLGRSAAGESFARGTYRQSLEVRKSGELVLFEPLLVEPKLQVREAAFGLAGRALSATLVASPADDGDERALVEALGIEGATAAPLLAGATLLDDVLVLRMLCADAIELRETLQRAWAVLRPRVLGRPACTPRVWRT
jgi:urease accessory protein